MRSALGQEKVNRALGGHHAPSQSSKKTVQHQARESFQLVTALVAGLIAGGLIGWQGHDFFNPHHSTQSIFRPATEQEAHRLFVRDGIDPKTEPLPISMKPEPKTDPPPTIKTERPIDRQFESPSSSPLPMAIPDGVIPNGSIVPTGPELPPIGAQGLNPEVHPQLDLHGLEAKIRTVALDVGGSVKNVRDSGNSRTVTISIKSDMMRRLESRLQHVGGNNVSIEEAGEDGSGDSDDTNVVGSAEVKAAQDAAIALKTELAKDEVSFLPQAPALRSIQAQYLEALKHLGQVRKANQPNAIVRVTLRGNS
jgi:hypothetical protein